MSAFTHRGVVYFAACGQYVKIGYTASSVEQRMNSLMNGRIIMPADLDASQPIEVLHTVPGCIMRDERRIHGLFAMHHAIGEWYHLNPALLRHLAGLRYVTDAQVLLRLRRARADLKRARRAAQLPRAA